MGFDLNKYLLENVKLPESGYGPGAGVGLGAMVGGGNSTIRSEDTKMIWRDMMVKIEALWLDVIDMSEEVYKKALTTLQDIRKLDATASAAATNMFNQLTKVLEAGAQEGGKKEKSDWKIIMERWSEVCSILEYINGEMNPSMPAPPGMPMKSKDQFDKASGQRESVDEGLHAGSFNVGHVRAIMHEAGFKHSGHETSGGYHRNWYEHPEHKGEAAAHHAAKALKSHGAEMKHSEHFKGEYSHEKFHISHEGVGDGNIHVGHNVRKIKTKEATESAAIDHYRSLATHGWTKKDDKGDFTTYKHADHPASLVAVYPHGHWVHWDRGTNIGGTTKGSDIEHHLNDFHRSQEESTELGESWETEQQKDGTRKVFHTSAAEGRTHIGHLKYVGKSTFGGRYSAHGVDGKHLGEFSMTSDAVSALRKHHGIKETVTEGVTLQCPNCHDSMGKDIENPKKVSCSNCGHKFHNPHGDAETPNDHDLPAPKHDYGMMMRDYRYAKSQDDMKRRRGESVEEKKPKVHGSTPAPVVKPPVEVKTDESPGAVGASEANESMEKLPHDAKFHSTDGGYSRISVHSASSGKHFFWKRPNQPGQVQSWTRHSMSNRGVGSEEPSHGKEIHRDHPAVKDLIRQHFSSEPYESYDSLLDAVVLDENKDNQYKVVRKYERLLASLLGQDLPPEVTEKVQSVIFGTFEHVAQMLDEAIKPGMEGVFLTAADCLIAAMKEHTDIKDAYAEIGETTPGHFPRIDLYVEWPVNESMGSAWWVTKGGEAHVVTPGSTHDHTAVNVSKIQKGLGISDEDARRGRHNHIDANTAGDAALAAGHMRVRKVAGVLGVEGHATDSNIGHIQKHFKDHADIDAINWHPPGQQKGHMVRRDKFFNHVTSHADMSPKGHSMTAAFRESCYGFCSLRLVEAHGTRVLRVTDHEGSMVTEFVLGMVDDKTIAENVYGALDTFHDSDPIRNWSPRSVTDSLAQLSERKATGADIDVSAVPQILSGLAVSIGLHESVRLTPLRIKLEQLKDHVAYRFTWNESGVRKVTPYVAMLESGEFVVLDELSTAGSKPVGIMAKKVAMTGSSAAKSTVKTALSRSGALATQASALAAKAPSGPKDTNTGNKEPQLTTRRKHELPPIKTVMSPATLQAGANAHKAHHRMPAEPAPDAPKRTSRIGAAVGSAVGKVKAVGRKLKSWADSLEAVQVTNEMTDKELGDYLASLQAEDTTQQENVQIADAYLTPALLRAYSKDLNRQKRTCDKCGTATPVYPGRYSKNCHGCGEEMKADECNC